MRLLVGAPSIDPSNAICSGHHVHLQADATDKLSPGVSFSHVEDIVPWSGMVRYPDFERRFPPARLCERNFNPGKLRSRVESQNIDALQRRDTERGSGGT